MTEKKKRRKWLWITVAIVVFMLMLGRGETEIEWNTHKFTILEDKDISSSNRARRRVTVLAPSALTPEDRIATLVEATMQVWQKHHSQYIGTFLLPFESGPAVARLGYAPDKCGISGSDCTNDLWTDAHASNAVFTLQQKEVYLEWQNNKDRFEEMDDEFGFEILNEQRLKVFLAKKFNTTEKNISKMFLEVSLASVYQDEITIPGHLKSRGQLSEQKQKAADDAACRASLQCWGDKNAHWASSHCPEKIERLARYTHEWTDGWGSKFDRFAWKDKQKGIVTYMGDKINFQNGFGAWIPHIYHCDYDTVAKKVVDLRIYQGRLD